MKEQKRNFKPVQLSTARFHTEMSQLCYQAVRRQRYLVVLADNWEELEVVPGRLVVADGPAQGLQKFI